MTPTLCLSAIAFALAGLVAAGPVASAPAQEGRPAEPVVSVASVLSDKDYPADAIRNREEGSVSFRLAIDSEGRVTGCEVSASSGSASLDSTTCRLMSTRVRFHPAANAAGKPATGTYEGRIVWRLPDPTKPMTDLPQRPSAAIGLWSACADGEAAKLALSSLAAADIAERAFEACAELEEHFVRELADAEIGLNGPRTAQAIRDDYSTRLKLRLEHIRGVLGPQRKSTQ